MNADQKPTHFAGFDWAKAHHDVLVIDSSGKVVLEFQFEHTTEGWAQCREKLAPFQALAVAIESGHADAAERLASMGHRVYPVHPKSSKAYRTRKRPSGTKTDRIDCLALAEALRFEGESWTQFKLPEPLLRELKILCRDEVALIEQRTALVNQLIQALYEYYPVALEAFDDWTSPSAWAFIAAFPTPSALVSAGKRKWEKFLHTHRLYNVRTYERRLKLFAKAQQFCGSDPVTAGKSTLAVALVRLLQSLDQQLEDYRKKIRKYFREHSDHAVFESLPGAGEKIAPRLLAELGSAPDLAADPQWLQTHGGWLQ
jgi:transposase